MADRGLGVRDRDPRRCAHAMVIRPHHEGFRGGGAGPFSQQSIVKQGLTGSCRSFAPPGSRDGTTGAFSLWRSGEGSPLPVFDQREPPNVATDHSLVDVPAPFAGHATGVPALAPVPPLYVPAWERWNPTPRAPRGRAPPPRAPSGPFCPLEASGEGPARRGPGGPRSGSPGEPRVPARDSAPPAGRRRQWPRQRPRGRPARSGAGRPASS